MSTTWAVSTMILDQHGPTAKHKNMPKGMENGRFHGLAVVRSACPEVKLIARCRIACGANARNGTFALLLLLLLPLRPACCSLPAEAP